MVRVAISGDRKSLPVYRYMIRRELSELEKSTIILVGDCTGVDAIATDIAKELGMEVHVFRASWNIYGKSAGPKRNSQILDQKPHLLLAFHVDISSSKGTKNMISQAEKRGIKTRLLTE